MKISLSWLKELVEYSLSPQQLADLLSLKSIGVKSITEDYIELDLTYNRGDLLSLRGVAGEVAAITNSKIKFENGKLTESDLPKVSVKVEDSKFCPVYCVAKVETLKVETSGKTWVKKLSDSGIRAINNVADITNLIMMEYGQPMHAFNAAKVKGGIKVRLAKEEEKIETLDAKIKNLSSKDLLIADESSPIGIAGVIGGKDSEISDSTTTILLEAAIFDPVSIRKTSKRLGLYSEASKRFIHGLTKTNLFQALAAAIKMYKGLGGKLTALTLTGDLEDKPKTIELNHEKVKSLTGVDIPSELVESSLRKLGFSLGGLSGPPPRWAVTTPYWRLDINIEEDLVEEVARMYGYEKIPAKELEGEVPGKLDQTLPNFIYQLKSKLADAGLTEIQTYSFYSSQVLSAISHQLSDLIKVANPISSETQYLRDKLWPNLIEIVAKNLKQGYKDIGIFEVGKVYNPKKGGLPEEKYHLSIALMNGTDNPLAELAELYKGVKLSHPKGVPLGDRNLFHPTRHTDEMAEVHPRILNKFGIEKRVAVLEMGFKLLTFN